MSKPLVTIVIPSYNRADYIAETIESVLAQTYPSIEVIVIDDGSTDNTKEIVERYVPQVQYVYQENAERGASRNHGLRLAQGEYISFLDSDDLWLPEKLATDVEFIEARPNIGVVYTDALQIDSNGNYRKRLNAGRHSGKVTEHLLRGNFILMGSHLVRTDKAREIGGFNEDRELSGSEDWEFWVRLSTITEFAYNPMAFAKIRTHEANTMSNPEGMERSMNCSVRLLETSPLLSNEQKKILIYRKANIALINAINYCSVKERRRSFSELMRAVSIVPSIIFDPRYAYTILRLLTGNKISKLRSKISN